MKKLILLVCYSLLISSCSLMKKDSKKESEGSLSSLDGVSGEELTLDGMEGSILAEERPNEENLIGSEIISGQLDEMTSSELSGPLGKTNGELKTYKVAANDTMMLVAFKLYGDYRRWREVAEFNGVKNLKEGMILKYTPPVRPFKLEQRGNPYLIKQGDTLGRISHSVYNTPLKWKSIWDNNRQLISNPNLIFAGFTLYYLNIDDLVALK